ncbi:MAG: hypothetical protein LBH96_02240 [Candidatus Peribacteria bacterium]|jgi:hypothetical protein|nr:hypothetical protein [Candidatus Peribacteria bacterium]
MRIYVKTPLFQNSKAIPHMVEHCVGHNMLSLSDFFEYSYGVDGIISPEYTVFEYDEWVDYQVAMQQLMTPLTKKAFDYEKKVLDAELSDPSYDQRIYERLVQLLINPQICLNSCEGLSWKKTTEYHQKWYHTNNMIVVNNDYQILYQGGNIPKKQHHTTELISLPFTFEEDEYLLLQAKNRNENIYWEQYFLFRIISFYVSYQMRWHQQEYYYLDPYFYTYDTINRVLLPKIPLSAFDQSFFEWGKKYILQMFSNGYFKEKFFLNTYIYNRPMERIDVIAFYQHYTWEDFYQFLQKSSFFQ